MSPPLPQGRGGWHLNLLLFPITQTCVGIRPRLCQTLFLRDISYNFLPMAFTFSDIVTMDKILNCLTLHDYGSMLKVTGGHYVWKIIFYMRYFLQSFTNGFQILRYGNHEQDLELINFSGLGLNFQGHMRSCFKINLVYTIFPVVLCWSLKLRLGKHRPDLNFCDLSQSSRSQGVMFQNYSFCSVTWDIHYKVTLWLNLILSSWNLDAQNDRSATIFTTCKSKTYALKNCRSDFCLKYIRLPFGLV